MCYHPKRIPNKHFNPNDPLSRRFLMVGCGTCPSCIALRVQEVAFRATQELAEITHRNRHFEDSFSCFLTTTYNRKYLPKVRYRYKGLVHTKSTWNMAHIRAYFKSLDHYFSKYFPGSSCKHLMTCERGTYNKVYTDDKGRTRVTTGRPHYHFIFFIRGVPEFCKAVVLEAMCERWGKWIPPTKKKPGYFDSYGRVDNIELDRTQDRCVYYVTKYSYKNPQERLFWIRPSMILGMDNLSSSADMYPRTLQSNGIGKYFFENFRSDWKSMVDYVINHSTDNSKMLIPRYYFKSCYRFPASGFCSPREDLPVFTWTKVHFSEVLPVPGRQVYTNVLQDHRYPLDFVLLPSFGNLNRTIGAKFGHFLHLFFPDWKARHSFAYRTTDFDIWYYDLTLQQSTESIPSPLGIEYRQRALDIQIQKHIRDVRAFIESGYCEFTPDFFLSQPFGADLRKSEIDFFGKFRSKVSHARVFLDSLSDEDLSFYVRSYIHDSSYCASLPFGSLFTEIMRANAFFRVYRSVSGFYAHQLAAENALPKVRTDHPDLFILRAPDDPHRLHMVKPL